MCTFDAPYSISYRCSIVTDSLSPAVFEILRPKHIGVTTLTFQGHVASSITWPFDSPYGVSYSCSIGTKSLSPSVFEIFASQYIGVTTLTFQGHVTSSVTWRFDSPYGLSYWCSIWTKSLSPSVFEILPPNISGSRPWPFGVTWRRWSCDHLMPHIAFPIGVPL